MLALVSRLSAVAAVAGCALSAFADPVQVKGVIDEVTVYRGQALVSRDVKVEGTGLVEVLVTDLPEHVVPASLYAEAGAGGAEVRSVRFRVRPVMQDVNEAVRKLDDQIRALDDKLRAAGKKGELLAEHRAYLAKLEAFIAPAANIEISKGVLNAETLTSLTQLLLTQRQTIADADLKLGLEQRELNEQKTLAVRERDTIAGRSNRTVREAVVLINMPQGAKGGSLHLKYLVDAAGWSPSYTVRADGKKDKVLVEYHAAIQQMSGEDWGDVAMTLSTATPNLVSRAPELKPMLVSLAAAAASQPAQSQGDYQNVRKELASRQREADTRRSMNGSQKAQAFDGKAEDRGQMLGGAVMEADQALNTLASDMQLLDLLSKDRVVRVSSTSQKREEGLSITYTLASRTSLPSRADVQQVQIAAMTMPAEFYKVATPVLTEYVYDEASVSNDSKIVLLAGPVAAYAEGRFVGSGDVATIAGGERFIVGFGIDSSLRASRELVEKTDNVQGGNRVVDLTYRLGIDNFGEAAAKVRLLDRLPKARESEIKLTLMNSEGSAEPEKKTGILRWDVTVPAAGPGNKALALEYKFRLEHDKQLMISGMPVAAK